MTNEFHNCVCGGWSYSLRATIHKILKEGFYFPKLFGKVHVYLWACEKCQMFVEKIKLSPFALILYFVEEPFREWALDFIGEIHPPSNNEHKWILMATYYFTKWVEAVPSRNATDVVVIKFMEENILAKFSCPRKIIIDNAQVFKFVKFLNFFQKLNIIMGHSTNYYP